MKHPLLLEREYKDAYRRLRNAYFLRYAVWYYGAVLLFIALVCALVWPFVDRAMLLIACSARLAVCLAAAENYSRRRSVRELSARGVLPEDWRPPGHELL